jgi:hypothetical protein
MSIPAAKANRFHRPLDGNQHLLAAIAAIAVAASSTAVAHSADIASQSVSARASAMAWGAGPMTTSLVEAVRHEGPLRDAEGERTLEFIANGPSLSLASHSSPALR